MKVAAFPGFPETLLKWEGEKNMSKAFDKFLDAINAVTGVILAILCAIVFVQVIMRYIFGHSLSWSEELTRYMFVWIIYLGVNLGIRGDNQIKIDLMDLALHGKALKVLHILQYLISMAACVFAMIGSYYLIQIGKLAKSPTLHAPMWLIYIVFPIGFVLDIIALGRKIYGVIQNWNTEEGAVTHE